ncbi:MAG: bZIP transcription factor [Desmonostoc vinosum HA7617-LM4]|jgi:hypothetical protein|nr:bZIP transcription factor [Desmonostoc vinosum HA7617-LM4]
MRASTGSVHRNSPNTQAYSPSVPISVYRELAAELQATQTRLNALTAQNQQLVQENQLLRQEITKVVQSFIHLQDFVDYKTTPSNHQASHTAAGVKSVAKQPVTPARPRQQASRPRPPVAPKAPSKNNRRQDFSVPVMEMYPMSEPMFIEEQEVRYYPTTESGSRELSGWGLIITILLIMLTAFGAGYLVVRPLFEHQNR